MIMQRPSESARRKDGRGDVLLRPNDPNRKGVRVAGGRRFYWVPVQHDLQVFQPWKPPGERRPRYDTYSDALAGMRATRPNLTRMTANKTTTTTTLKTLNGREHMTKAKNLLPGDVSIAAGGDGA
ncbi:MAG: hypothetical protein C0480_11955 [Bradyrhizobium sp.]|nr:hypothetical protein [Bradyrhizobium sp.]